MPVGVSAYVALANITLGANAASVSFSSISQSYRDLVCVVVAKHNSGASPLFMRVNGSAAGIYQANSMAGDGTNIFSQTTGLVTSLSLAQGQNILGTSVDALITFSIQDFSSTNKHKPVLSRADRSDFITVATAGRIETTSAITSFNLFCNGQFVAGSTFALYGVSA